MNTKAFILSCSVLCSMSSFAYANPQDENLNIGGFHVRDNPIIEKKAEDIDLEKVKQKEAAVNKNKVGNMNVAQFVLGEQKKHKAPDTKEIIELKQKLVSVVDMANSKQYHTASLAMRQLVNEHPELITLPKWAGVYANLAGEYDSSREILNKLKLQFPLSESKINKDFMIRYYEIDNLRNLEGVNQEEIINQINQTRLDLKNTDQTELKNFSGLPEEMLIEFLLDYQQFLVLSQNGENIESTKLDALWAKLSPNVKNNLDDFYGYDIDNLTYLYATHYNRKDLLEVYIKHNEKASNQDTIKKVKRAKSILAQKY